MTSTDRRRAPRLLILLFASASLVGCDVTDGYQAPRFSFLPKWSGSGAGAPVLLGNTGWWRDLGDPLLDQLIELALRQNLDLALARERVAEAEAGRAGLSTGAAVEGRLRAERGSETGVSTHNQTGATAGFSWLFDPWGGRRAEARAAGARIGAADAERDAAQLLVLSNVAEAYVDLRRDQRMLQLRREEEASRRRSLALVRELADRGAATRYDTVRTDALLAETRVEIPALEAAIAADRHRLAVLLGQAPGTLGINLDSGARQPRPRMPPDTGIPADLLRNRPDIRIAERLYYAAVADSGTAEAALYPRLSLSGTLDLDRAHGVSDRSFYFGPSLALPVLPDNTARASLAAARSRARQAHVTWRSTVLGALEEVETAQARYAAATRSVSAAEKTVRLYREAADMTREMLAADGATVSELIDAEQAIARANITLATNVAQLALAWVALNVALGSGSTAQAPP